MNASLSDSSAQLSEVKDRITNISGLPLEEHCDEFEKIHGQLQQVLSEIDGL